MVAGTNALIAVIASVDSGKAITESAIKIAHRTLMKDVSREQESAGEYRRVQNWIDGSNHSPRGAIFVPLETIHPFTDGNGRIGRALVNAILRRKRVTTRIVVPIASFLVANRKAYFEDLNKYRGGHIESLLTRFAGAANIASVEAGRTATTLCELPAT
jgi:Fic family protein